MFNYINKALLCSNDIMTSLRNTYGSYNYGKLLSHTCTINYIGLVLFLTWNCTNLISPSGKDSNCDRTPDKRSRRFRTSLRIIAVSISATDFQSKYDDCDKIKFLRMLKSQLNAIESVTEAGWMLSVDKLFYIIYVIAYCVTLYFIVRLVILLLLILVDHFFIYAFRRLKIALLPIYFLL